jgi:serine/threonine protein kinase
MEQLDGLGKRVRLVNARSDLGQLIRSLPERRAANEEEIAGRVPLPPGTKLQKGDFVLGDVAGCGSFGLIYEATDARIGQDLAIKEFFPCGYVRAEDSYQLQPVNHDPGELKVLKTQFEEEFKVLERFERPGIVKVYNLFSEKGGTFLVMEMLKGATVNEILETHKSLEEALSLWLIRRLINTLETIHLSGLVHGDIKPENLFLTNDGQLILLDFGAVNHYLTKGQKAPRFLTPGYAPPEQYKATSVPDPANDLYAVGATLYEMLTGSPPPDSLERAKGKRLPAPTRKGALVSGETVSALGRTLALASEKRPASAHALLGLLPTPEVQVPNIGATWEQLSPWEGHRQAIVRIRMTSDGQLLATADKSGQLRLWSVKQERCLGVVEFDREVIDIAIHPEDKWLAVALAGGQVDLMDFSTGKPQGTLRDGTPPVSCIAFTPDGKNLICGLYDGRVEIRSLAKKGKKKILSAHDAPVNRATFSPSGRLMALASNDRSASVWDLKSGRQIRCFDGHHRPVQIARFSPCGRFLVTGGSDMSLRMFDVKRGDEFRRLKGHEAMVWDILYLEDGTLLTCSADRTVRLWDTQNFRESECFPLSEAWLCSMAFSEKSSTLYVAGVDKWIHRLRVLSEKEQALWS